jgi:hypothetical protein
MVAEDFLQDPRVREWLDGIEPAWTLLTFTHETSFMGFPV